MRDRYWWMTPEARERKYRELQGEKFEEPIKQKKKRNQYRRGAKAYLASFDVGEIRQFQYDFSWDGLRSIASKMKRDFGCRYTFCTTGYLRHIKREQ
jgi:hypothetical protein